MRSDRRALASEQPFTPKRGPAAGKRRQRKGWKKPDEDKWMTATELSAFMHEARRYRVWPEAYFFFFTVYLLGLRVGEGMLLEWSDVDRRSDTRPVGVYCPTLKRRKQALPRLWVPVLSYPNIIAATFSDTRRARLRSPHVFPNRLNRHEPVPRRTLLNHFERIRDAAFLKPAYTSHSLRHTAAEMFLKHKRDTRALGRFLRHQVVRRNATDHYIHTERPDWAAWSGALDLPPLQPLPLLKSSNRRRRR